uniref:Protein kinase domain-containing protein n=1 Tax=Romanomermis culicivorax TaxID=13658 RepID=A0A915HZ29_ROMCU
MSLSFYKEPSAQASKKIKKPDSHARVFRHNFKKMEENVKPSNILLNRDGTIKLCDFGISGRLVDSKAATQTAGCAAYMAPERIQPPDPTNANYDVRADVWSLGISLVEMALGRFPYGVCENHFEILTKILLTDSPTLSPKDGFTPTFCNFLSQCLAKNFNKRPKYPQLLQRERFLDCLKKE